MFKKLIEKIKSLYAKIINWLKIKVLPWLKRSWMEIVNLFVLFIVYGNTDSLPGVQTISGLWIFILLAYYIFFKLFGFSFKKKE